ncbi:MAG: acetoacetate decarboxylase family protein [Myxococcales bacterium]
MHELGEQPVQGRATEAVCERLGPDRFRVDGRELSLPMEIADCSLLAQVFAVRSNAARALLEGTGLRLAELWPGTTALSLLGVQYRDNPLGDYGEAAILLPAFAPGERGLPLLGGLDMLLRRAGQFVYAMPVDQPFTTHAGRFLWGYPKFLAELSLRFEPPRASVRFSHDGELVFALSAPADAAGALAETRGVNLTARGGVVRRVEASFGGRGRAVRLGGEPPEVGERHPLARTLRELGLPKRPLLSASLLHAHARFGVPAEAPVGQPLPR